MMQRKPLPPTSVTSSSWLVNNTANRGSRAGGGGRAGAGAG
eukprot:SAG22_NODE_11125_length_499_cov_1.132500_1_plen_40_part_10